MRTSDFPRFFLFYTLSVTTLCDYRKEKEHSVIKTCRKELNMSREQARENLKSFGIEEPTDEQITAYLNQVGSETKKEKERAEAFKAQASKADELKQKLDELNNANLSEVEKANKATEDANKQIAELNKKIANMELKAQLAEKGIVGEDADALISADGKLDIEVLGRIISERETASASAKEKELLDNTPSPQGNGGGNDDDAKPLDVANAEKISFGAGVDTANKDYYKL